jgi:hypothetical protein
LLGRLKAAFKSFQENDVRYLVIGGIASVLYGVPRATFDLDILIEPTEDNAGRLLKALLEAGLATAAMTTAEELLANEITIFKDRVRIDVQTSTPGIMFEEAWKRRTVMNYLGQDFFVVSREDLIDSKRSAGRPVDLSDVALLTLDKNNEEKGKK